MRAVSLMLALLVAGCGSSGKGDDASTDPDAADDAIEEVDAFEDVADTAGDQDSADTPGDEPADGGCAVDTDCDDSDPCTMDVCTADTGECSHDAMDADGDGYVAAGAGGEHCGGTDCDDADADVFPGAPTTCDDVDDDCSGNWADESGADDDGDGHLDASCGGDDCDDDRADVFAGADAVCLDGVDQDCDGKDDGPQVADIRVTSVLGLTWDPDLAWTGSGFGVLFYDQRNGNQDVFFATVSADGSTVGSDVMVSTDTTAFSMEGTLAWSGSEFLACFNDDRSGEKEILCRRVGADGAPAGAEIVVTSTGARSEYPDLAWTGSEYMVAFEEDSAGAYTQVRIQRLGPAGALVGAAVPVAGGVTSHAYSPAIAWSGSQLGLCWMREASGPNQILCSLRSGDGSPLGTDVDVSQSAGYSQEPSVAWTASELAVVWVESASGSDAVYAARLAATGAPVGFATRLTVDLEAIWATTVEWTDGSLAVAYSVSDGTYYSVHVLSASADLSSASPPGPVAAGAFNSYDPSLAWTGSVLGLAWDAPPTGDREIWMNLLTLCE